ncbi:MAG: ribosomal protein S18-alanine N-acetyltransferase [Coprobacillus sp.]|nr:ribosomal protein S18-alanine N-acetyltransferase [Coprobacillus sp.]
MLIRKMDIDDLNQVVVLEEQLFTSSWSYKDFLYELLENDFSFNYVIEDDLKIVGYVGVWMMYEQAQITTIGVAPDYQRQGLGRNMLETIIALTQKHGCEMMSLEVRISNDKAISLYESLGFHKETIRKNYYQDNQEDAYLMIKRLGV